MNEIRPTIDIYCELGLLRCGFYLNLKSRQIAIGISIGTFFIELGRGAQLKRPLGYSK